jgi:hypothetical protein
VNLLLNVSEEVDSKAGLWRQALRVLALLSAFKYDYFLSDVGLHTSTRRSGDAQERERERERERKGHVDADEMCASRLKGEGECCGSRAGGAVDEGALDCCKSSKIEEGDRIRLLLGLKRLLGVDQTELQTDAMQGIYIYVPVYVCMYVCMYVCVCVCACRRACVFSGVGVGVRMYV